MHISVKCPHCNHEFSVEEKYAGKRGKCPNPSCRKSIVVAENPKPGRNSDGASPLNVHFSDHSEANSADSQISETSARPEVRAKVEGLFALMRRPGPAPKGQQHDELEPGQTIADFTIVRPLGSGGMGQVYLAHQKSLNRLVALKVCRAEVARDSRMRRRFETEGLSLAQLRHPNIVPVLATGEDRGHLYLAMEYIDGPTLADVLNALRTAPPEAIARDVVSSIMTGSASMSPDSPSSTDRAKLDRSYRHWVTETLAKVAQGLAAVHRAGILHRDIKPSNIVLDQDAQPRIVDFGLARADVGSSVTQSGEFFGTPAYASPEQARGDVPDLSPASDVFSFGVMFFECLSLSRPFEGASPVNVLVAVIKSEPPLLRKLDKRTPWELEAIVDKCLRKDPHGRYQSGTELALDIRNFLEMRAIVAKRATAIARVTRHIRRRPWVAAFLGVLALAVIFGGAAAAIARQQYVAQLAQEQQRRYDALVYAGDVALFRTLIGLRPTWLPHVTDKSRQDAINAYTSAISIQPEAVWPIVQRGRLYLSKPESLELAIVDFRRAAAIQPQYASVRRLMGHALREIGREEDARAELAAAEQIYGSSD